MSVTENRFVSVRGDLLKVTWIHLKTCAEGLAVLSTLDIIHTIWLWSHSVVSSCI